MKKLFKIAIALVLILGITVFAASPIIGSYIKGEVETKGSEMAQAEIKLGDVSFSLIDGTATMSNIFIGNPEGFQTDSAFKLGEANIVVDLKSVMEDVIIIKEIKILNPEITYEIGVLGSNIATIQKNIENAIGSTTSTSTSEGESGDASGGKKIIIENLYIEEAKVRLGFNAGGKSDDLNVKIPAIHMKDIGKEKGGVSKAEAGRKILVAINKELVKHGGAGSVVNKVKGWFN